MTGELEKPSIFDTAAAEMMHAPQIECPVFHHFVPGFYIREFRAPKGACIISKIHKTRHAFSISKGVVSVFDEKNGWQTHVAPFHGMTEPGTQRALIVHENLIWSTSHPIFPSEVNNPEAIEARIIENKKNPLLSEEENNLLETIKQFHSQNPTPQLDNIQ